MRGIIKSHYNLINDNFFLNLFNISYVLIMEDEIEKINTKDLELIDTINTKEKNYSYLKIVSIIILLLFKIWKN